MGTVRSRRTLVLLVAAILTGSPVGEVRAGEPEPLQRLSPEIRVLNADGGNPLAIIVHIDAPAEAMAELSPDSTASDRLRSEVLEPLFEQTFTRLTADLSSVDLTDIRPFRLQPAFAAVVTEVGLARLLADPAVRYVEPDRRYRNHTQEGLEMIGAFDLHREGYSGAGAAVAIIDTGIDYHHPTLGGAAIPNAKVVHGLDTADLDDDPMDCGAHGTAVASVAAGTSFQWNPQRRFAGGVAPQAKILAYKASPDSDCGAFAQSAVIAAIEDAVLNRNGEDYQLAAINLSLGSGAFEGPCDGLVSSWAHVIAAATQAGVAVVASSGNEGHATALAAPACLTEVISVASVWDSEPGLITFSFCLDPECTAVCNDSFRPAGSVTCYSNAGSVLDLYAPSEFLRAARAGDETGEFGGTSGAAAYVTGALALIRQAAPQLSPGGARRLLQLTGVPTLDQRSGVIRPAVHLSSALEALGSVLPSNGPAATIPDLSGDPAVSTVEVTEDGWIGSVRVLLNLAHPNPEDLRVVLRSPDGTVVRLHDRAAGTIAGGGNPATATHGVWGTYPDDIAPVDSLGLFGGLQMAGVWTLEVFDEVPGNGGSTPAVLVGWALHIEAAVPPGGPDLDVLTIPVAAHVAGSRGTHWVSDVRILNPSEERAARGRLYLVPSSADGTVNFRQTDLVVPPLTVVDLPDVFARRFAAEETRGTLRLQTDLPGLISTSRTFTADSSGGTFGQFIGAASPVHTTAMGEEPLALLHLSDTPEFRTNVGFTEVAGHPTIVELTIIENESGGSPIQTTRHVVEPFSNLQFRVDSGLGSASLIGLARVVEGQGRIVAYGSTVDNQTGDAVFVPAIRPQPKDELMLPVVARTPGQSGTDWRTELRIANLEDHTVDLIMEFRPRRDDPGQPVFIERSVLPWSVLKADDVLAVFGLNHGVGSVRVTVLQGPSTVAATARIFNSTHGGTYGQFVAAADSNSGRSAAISHADSNLTTRTNLGVCEVGGGSITIRATLLDTFGRPIADPILLTAEPYQLVQVDDVFAAADQTATSNAWIQLELVAGDGDFFAYGSMVDSVTGDAIFVPSRPLPEAPPPYPEP